MFQTTNQLWINGWSSIQGGAPVRQGVQLVNIKVRHFTFGLMKGGYIYSIHGDYKPTIITGGAPPCTYFGDGYP